MKRPRWQTEGQEPDYRFTLANERTFLAWMRTALALLAGGVLLEQFASRMDHAVLLLWVAVALILLSVVVAACAYLRWKDNEIAMRHLAPLPASMAIPIVTVAVGAIAVALIILSVAQVL